MRILNWALFLLTFYSVGLNAPLAADDEVMCPREGELDAFPREVLDAVFWEAGGIDHLAMHSEDRREISFRVLSMDDEGEKILDSTSIHLFNLGVLAPIMAPASTRPMPADIKPSNVERLSHYIGDPRFSAPQKTAAWGPAERLSVFFIRDGISGQAEIESIIDDLMRRDGSNETDTITINECRITRLRKGWEIGSTKLILPRENSRKQDLECAVSALFFHYGISNVNYIESLEKVIEVDGRHIADLGKNILRGLYSPITSYPRFQPGLTRCEFVSRFYEPISK